MRGKTSGRAAHDRMSGMIDDNRRSFLKASVASLGSSLLIKGQSPNDTIRVAFIGVGNRGSFLLKHMLTVPGITVVAICDIDADRLSAAMAAANAAGSHAAGYSEYRKLLDLKNVDAVVIATPVDLHKEMAIASLEVGKHVYCEKPMALDVEQCRMVTTAAANAKGIFQQGFQVRRDPSRAASMKFMHEGGLGKVVCLRGHRHTSALPRNTPWYFDRTRSGD